jgi:hypothetical protein
MDKRIMVNTALNYLKKSRKYQYDLLFDSTELHVVTSDDPEVLLMPPPHSIGE